MRPITQAELDAWLGSGTREHRVRVRRPADAAFTDLSNTLGGDWALAIQSSGENPDQPAGRFTVRFLKHTAEGTLSPGIGTDPLLHPGSAVEVDSRVNGGAWRMWLQGEVEDAEWAGAEVRIECLTLDAAVLAAQIEAEEERGAPDPGTPLADEIQGLLNRWMGSTAPTLVTVGNPDAGVGEYKTQLGSLGEHVRDLAGRIGWDLRYRWNEAAQNFRLTLHLPPRDKATVDLTVPAAQTLEVAGVKQTRKYVRNAIRVRYMGADGEAEAYRQDDASIQKYRKQAMVLDERGEESSIKTAAAANRLIDYALHDLGKPLVDGRYRIPFLPFLELYDVLVFQADNDHFDQDVKYSVVGVSHKVEGEGGAYTEVELRGGTPVGQFLEWHKRVVDAENRREAPPVIALRNFRETRLSSAEVRYDADPTPAVHEVWIHRATVPKPVSVEPWPVEGDIPGDMLPAATAFPLVVPVPGEGTKTYLQFEPRGSKFEAGEIRRATVDSLPGSKPTIERIKQAPGTTLDTTDLVVVVSDPAKRAGVLRVWVNKASHDDADPAAAFDAEISTAETPRTFTSADHAALDEIRVHAAHPKRIFLEFVTEDGVSTGQIDFLLRNYLDLIDPTGQLVTGAIKHAYQFAASIRPPEVVAALPALPDPDYPVGSLVTLVPGDGTSKLYRNENNAWTAAVPTVDLVGTIATGQIADAAISAAKIGAGAVETAKIAVGAVTEALLAANAVSTAKLAVGAVTEAVLAANAVTTAKLALSAVTADILAAGAVTETKITDGAISTPKLSAGAVTTAKLAAGAVTAGEIAAGAITTAKIAAGAVTANEIAALTIAAGNIAAGAITTAKLAAGAVTANELAAGSVIAGKIAAGTIVAADIAAGTITGDRIAAATITAGNIAALTITADQIAANTITGAKIAADTITAGNIAAGAITASELAAESVVAGKIAAGAISTSSLFATGVVTATVLAAGAVVAGKIAAGAINATDIIADGVITAAKINVTDLSSINANFSGTVTSSGTIAASTFTAATASFQGNIYSSGRLRMQNGSPIEFYSVVGGTLVSGGTIIQNNTNLEIVGSNGVIVADGFTKLGFFGQAPDVKQAVAGSRGGIAALESLLTILANYGLITNNSTA